MSQYIDEFQPHHVLKQRLFKVELENQTTKEKLKYLENIIENLSYKLPQDVQNIKKYEMPNLECIMLSERSDGNDEYVQNIMDEFETYAQEKCIKFGLDSNEIDNSYMFQNNIRTSYDSLLNSDGSSVESCSSDDETGEYFPAPIFLTPQSINTSTETENLVDSNVGVLRSSWTTPVLLTQNALMHFDESSKIDSNININKSPFPNKFENLDFKCSSVSGSKVKERKCDLYENSIEKSVSQKIKQRFDLKNIFPLWTSSIGEPKQSLIVKSNKNLTNFNLSKKHKNVQSDSETIAGISKCEWKSLTEQLPWLSPLPISSSDDESRSNVRLHVFLLTNS